MFSIEIRREEDEYMNIHTPPNNTSVASLTKSLELSLSFEVLFQQRVRVFDHGIKTRECNKSRGAKPRAYNCFRVFSHRDQTHRMSC